MKNCLLVAALLVVGLSSNAFAQKRPMTFEDVMKFKQLRNPSVSDGGNWIGYDAWPDRGDGEALIQHTRQNARRFLIPLGQKPVFSPDEKWAAVATRPSLAAEEQAKKKKLKALGDVILVDLTTGKLETFRYGRAFEFSPDGKKFWVHFSTPDSLDKLYKKSKRLAGSKLVLRDLAGSTAQREWAFAYAAAFDSVSANLALSIADTSGQNSLRLIQASAPAADSVIHARKDLIYEKLKWHFKSGQLAFTAGLQDKEGRTLKADLHVWPPRKSGETILSSSDRFRSGWIIPSKAELTWTHNGRHLYFGVRPDAYKPVSYDDSAFTERHYYDTGRILSGIEGDLWHHGETRIKTHEKKVKDRWKTQFFTAVFSLDQNAFTVLSDTAGSGLRSLRNAPVALQWTDRPYAASYVWQGTKYDAFVIKYEEGRRIPVAKELQSPPEISPDGRFVVYWKAPHWHLFNVETAETVNLTQGLPVRFDDEDFDMPAEPSPHGFGGWTHNAAGVLLYDRFDVWMFPTAGGAPKNVTGTGRTSGLQFRLVRTTPDFETFATDKPLLLTARHDAKKHQGLYTLTIARAQVKKLVEDPAKYTFVARPKKSDQLVYARQSYNDFPDLWIADAELKKPLRLTMMNPVIREIAWGKPELVEYQSADGRPLQGMLIRPDDFQPGRPVPVLVYFYEIMSDRMYDFPAVNIDTRPDFAYFASNGYAVFLPDIVYRLDGNPMKSAYDCLIPGVRKIIDMGVADSNAIGLHGHSWGGTQTTYLIARTNLFKAAVAGAPITDWVSGYSGIRWESGLARQFQYEQSQSRIGASLWDKPELYLDNSAVWHATGIRTPLLLQHGDADGAVPWYQSIEMFLALKRLGQPVWFLQYFGEDHHLAKYPNKLDYAIKFVEFFNHYLKGAPMPVWMKDGIPYRPKD